jgi:hypothetical protein
MRRSSASNRIFISAETREASKALSYGHVDGAPDLWLDVLSWVKTLFDLTKSTVDLVDLERTHRNTAAILKQSGRLSASASNFRRFPRLRSSRYWIESRVAVIGSSHKEAVPIVHGSIRSVLNGAREGNGGKLPLIDDWRKIYDQLACSNHA